MELLNSQMPQFHSCLASYAPLFFRNSSLKFANVLASDNGNMTVPSFKGPDTVRQ